MKSVKPVLLGAADIAGAGAASSCSVRICILLRRLEGSPLAWCEWIALSHVIVEQASDCFVLGCAVPMSAPEFGFRGHRWLDCSPFADFQGLRCASSSVVEMQAYHDIVSVMDCGDVYIEHTQLLDSGVAVSVASAPSTNPHH